MKEKREQRLNSEFQKSIYEILREKVKDPDLSEMFSILEVDTTNDLKHAKVFVSIYSTSEDKKQKTFEAMIRAGKFIRSEMSKEMHIRTVPELHFTLDNSAVYGQKIEKILNTFEYNTEPDDENK